MLAVFLSHECTVQCAVFLAVMTVSFFVHGCPTLTAVSAAAAVLTADKWHRS